MEDSGTIYNTRHVIKDLALINKKIFPCTECLFLTAFGKALLFLAPLKDQRLTNVRSTEQSTRGERGLSQSMSVSQEQPDVGSRTTVS